MKYFGTDGIRGKADMFTDDLLKRFVAAVCKVAKEKSVLIARDNRTSGRDIESRLCRLLVKAGFYVQLVGVLPTPVCAFLTRELNAELGIMISASHNPPEFNGIKLFNRTAGKLTEEEEKSLDGLISQDLPLTQDDVGYFTYVSDASNIYLRSIVGKSHSDLSGMKVLLDTANGATACVAPEAFKLFGAEVTTINDSPDGNKINERCGATYPQAMLDAMKNGGFDLGFAYDGDGDRVIAAKNGKIYDGDHLMYMLAKDARLCGNLNHGVVISVLGNMGVEEACKKQGIPVERTDVGDKFIAEKMCETGYEYGSEASGHVICGNHLPTGDGIFTSLQVAGLLLKHDIEAFDDIKESACVSADMAVSDMVAEKVISMFRGSKLAEGLKLNNVRFVVRKSGTESKIRIMAEAKDKPLAEVSAMAIASLVDSYINY